MVGHLRDGDGGIFGQHRWIPGDDCDGTLCDSCGCCMHCTEPCICDDHYCGCKAQQ